MGEEAAVAVAADVVDDLAVDLGDGEVELEGEVEGLVDELFFGGIAEMGAVVVVEGGLGLIDGQAGGITGGAASGKVTAGEGVTVQEEVSFGARRGAETDL